MRKTLLAMADSFAAAGLNAISGTLLFVALLGRAAEALEREIGGAADEDADEEPQRAELEVEVARLQTELETAYSKMNVTGRPS